VGEAEYALWHVVAREPVEVLALVESHPQGAGQNVKHRRRWLSAAAALKAAVIVHRHDSKLGDLFASQPLDAASRAQGESDIFRSQRFATRSEECC
jgi:hypothetical protein